MLQIIRWRKLTEIIKYCIPGEGMTMATVFRRLLSIGVCAVALFATGASQAQGFPELVGVATGANDGNSTAHTITVPAPAGASSGTGDLLVGFVAFSSNANGFGAEPAGWSLFWSGSLVYGVLRVDDGAGAPSFDVQTNAAVRSAHAVYRIREGTYRPVSFPLPFDSVPGVDPPLVTLPDGPARALWIATVQGQTGSDETPGAPAGYSETLTSALVSDQVGIVTAWRTVEAASEDPGAFTGLQAAIGINQLTRLASTFGILGLPSPDPETSTQIAPVPSSTLGGLAGLALVTGLAGLWFGRRRDRTRR